MYLNITLIKMQHPYPDIFAERCCKCNTILEIYCEIKINGSQQIINLCVSCVISHGIAFNAAECVSKFELFGKRLTASDKNVLKKQPVIVVFRVDGDSYYAYLNNIKLIDSGICYRVEECKVLSMFFELPKNK